MALQLTTEQGILRTAFTTFFNEVNTTTVCGNAIDKATLEFFVDMNGVLFAKAQVAGATGDITPIINPFKIAKKVATAAPTANSCVWTMKGVCTNNPKFNLVNMLPRR